MDAFRNVPTAGKIAMRFGTDEEGDATDRLIGVSLLTEEEDVLLATQGGKAIRFPANAVREFQSRTATGVRGISLAEGDEVISLSILKRVGTTTEEKEEYLRFAQWKPDKEGECSLSPERYAEIAEKEQFILTVTARGYGKRSSAYEYRRTNRGGLGITNINRSDDFAERNGPVVASFPARSEEQIMLVTDQAKLIRMKIGDVRVIGRGSAGVKMFDVAEGELVVAAARIDEEEEPENEAEEAIAEEIAERDPATGDQVRLDDGTGPDTLPDSQEEDGDEEDRG
jgi:DNA gyrase subunit A